MKLRVKINVSFLCFQKQVAVKMPNFFFNFMENKLDFSRL